MKKYRSLVKWYLPWIFHSLYFNLKYLPFRQAIRLPILLHHPDFITVDGNINIEGSIRFGMIRLGARVSNMHQHKPLIWEVDGHIVFKGAFSVATGCSICVGKDATLILGEGVFINADAKICCQHSITIGKGCRISWDVLLIDTSFHPIINVLNGKEIKPYGSIVLGEYNWIGHNCLIMKGTKTPNYIIVAAGSQLSSKYRCEEKTILKGVPAVAIAEGCFCMPSSRLYQ